MREEIIHDLMRQARLSDMGLSAADLMVKGTTMRNYLGITRAWPCFLAVVILLTGCSGQRSTGGSTASGMSQAGRSTTDQSRGQKPTYISSSPAQRGTRGGQSLLGEEVTVGMTNELRYVPEEVTILLGQAVVWTNTSTVVHTVTADPALAKQRRSVQLPEGAQPFNSGPIAPGATFRHTFDVPGLYVYFCIPHELEGMIGRINVRGK
jgi:plastocyanin